MTDSFDPYYKWLGIKPKDQPPNHYRLLGVELFESDLDVIENAADQRMRHMRSLQGGANADASQRILNEVAAARICLIDPLKRAEYNRQLQTVRAVAPSAVPPSAPPAMGTAAPPIAAAAPPKAAAEPAIALAERPRAPEARAAARSAPVRSRMTSRPRSGFPLGLVFAIGALIGVVVLVLVLMSVLRQDRGNIAQPHIVSPQVEAPPPQTTGGSTPPPRTIGGSTAGSVPTPVRPKPTGELHLHEIANVTVEQGTQLRVQAMVRDPQRWQNKVRFAAGLGTPPDAKVDPSSGWIEWSPPKGARRTYLFNIEVHAGPDEDTTAFQVDLPWARGDLVFHSPSSQTAYPEETMTVGLSATDDVGSAEGARFELVSGPAGASVDSQSGQFRWQPGSDQLDKTTRVTVRVTDARGVSATKTFSIRVENKPPPTFDGDGSRKKDGESGGPRRFDGQGAVGDGQRRRFMVLRFSGRDYVSTSWRYDGNTPLTLEAIVAPSEVRQSAVLGCMHLSGVGLTITGDNRWAFVVRDRDRNCQVISDEPAAADRRVHLAGVFAEGKVRLFVDGKPQRETANVEKFVPSPHPLLIGADTNGQGQPEAFFLGNIMAVRATAQALYSESFAKPWRLDSKDASTLLLNFDRGEGDEVHDRSGKTSPAKIHGATWVPRERRQQ